jgi:hypothetical protein
LDDISIAFPSLSLILSKLKSLCPSGYPRSVAIQVRVLGLLEKVFLKIPTLDGNKGEAKKRLGGEGLSRSQLEHVITESFGCLRVFVEQKKEFEYQFPPEVSEAMVGAIRAFLVLETPNSISVDETIEVFLRLLKDNDERVRVKMSKAIKVMFEIFPSHVDLFADMAQFLPGSMISLVTWFSEFGFPQFFFGFFWSFLIFSD